MSNSKKRKPADLLVIPIVKHEDKPKLEIEDKQLTDFLYLLLASGDFKGSEGEVVYLYPPLFPEKRIALIGLGPINKITSETLRRSFGQLVKSCHSKKIKTLNILYPTLKGIAEAAGLKGIVEGLLLPNYQFTKLKHETLKDNPPTLIEAVTFIGINPINLDKLNQYKTICEGVYFARDLVNGNADEISSHYLANVAVNMAKVNSKLKVTIFDKQRIEKEKMGLLLAVNRGSVVDPAFIIIEYKGAPKTKKHTVLIGKGVTYDTGGLNLKATGMETMKADMAGAATAMATVKTAAELKLPIHLTAVIPCTDNQLSATSYKPGDVYSSYTGKTVEISNTDAEGRLILADALAYAEKNLNPTCMIDFATLTGGIEIALGGEAIGMMSNDDALSDSFVHAGSTTFERVWRLPLFEEYKDNLRSDVADIKNCGTRSASSITGAIFLQQFISNRVPWAHFDIASTAFFSEAKRYNPKFATGVGVRLMIEFLQNQ